MKINLEQTLTKENFWDEIMKQYPKACTNFCEWIDEYKKAVGWNSLFNSGKPLGEGQVQAPKFHEIPYAMQYGIWIKYCRETLDEFFEQPEHISDSVDLEEDIKGCFAELEPLIDDAENN